MGEGGQLGGGGEDQTCGEQAVGYTQAELLTVLSICVYVLTHVKSTLS